MAEATRLDADVVVVGGGGSGLAAALEAASSGRRVILLEKNPYLGGTTRLAVGSVSACCTPHQRRRGIQDSPREFFEDMGRFNQDRDLGSRDNLELRRLLVEASAETLEWLMGMEVLIRYYLARAEGGTGLITVEMPCPPAYRSPEEGRSQARVLLPDPEA